VDGAAAGGAAAGEIGHPSAECVPSSALLPCSVISLASHDYTVSDSKVFYHAFAAVCAQRLDKDQVFRHRQHEWSTLGIRSRRRLDRSGVGLEVALKRAQMAISQVRAATSPSGKLRGMAGTVEAVSSELSNADDLLQALIRALLTSEIKSPHAEVAFVLEYAHEGVSSTGFDGYTLATFQAAAEAISSLEIDVLFAVEGEGGGGEGGGGDGGGGNGGCGDGGGDNDGGDDDGGSSDGGGGEGGVQATKIGE